MAKRTGISLSSVFFLQLALGLFFLSLGILGLVSHDSSWSELRRAFGRNDSMELIISIAELVAGGILILGLFVSIAGDTQRIVSLCLFGLWALYLVVTYFMNGFAEPDFAPWLYEVSMRAVILVGLWVIGRR
jgi:hypothetical protein